MGGHCVIQISSSTFWRDNSEFEGLGDTMHCVAISNIHSVTLLRRCAKVARVFGRLFLPFSAFFAPCWVAGLKLSKLWIWLKFSPQVYLISKSGTESTTPNVRRNGPALDSDSRDFKIIYHRELSSHIIPQAARPCVYMYSVSDSSPR